MKKLLLLVFSMLLVGCETATPTPFPTEVIPTPVPTATIIPHNHDLYFSISDGSTGIERFAIVPEACFTNVAECATLRYLPLQFEQSTLSPLWWSPDGQYFIAEQLIADHNTDLVVGNEDVNTVKNITNNPAQESFIKWISNDTFLFTRDVSSTGVPEIWTMDREGNHQRKWANGCCADVSSDGKFYYLAPGKTSNSNDLFMILINPQGDTIMKNLTNASENIRALSISPDGKTIALSVLSADNSFLLYFIDADGSNMRKVNTDLPNPYNITWSPDGQKLALTSSPSHNSLEDVYVLNLSDDHAINISHVAGKGYAASDPVWSPDGHQLLMIFRNTSDIYIANADGTNLHPITHAKINMQFNLYSWRP